VRKVGDDDYEISSQRHASRAVTQLPVPREEAGPPAASDNGLLEVAAAPEAAPPTGRENGQRFGVRFRRGSRGPLRAGEIPLIGVVQIEQPAPPEAEPTQAAAEPIAEGKRPRTRRPPRKRAVAVPTTDADDAPQAGESPPAKRPRTRSRKKAE
jgi:hypothetical protein